mmetsp:Transcript_36400/g.85102  ORF Transcript_36400/g.85102 Transcript_36400/m.85102 type:complete len:83 (-) Transcript_36400:996-1244(-)
MTDPRPENVSSSSITAVREETPIPLAVKSASTGATEQHTKPDVSLSSAIAWGEDFTPPTKKSPQHGPRYYNHSGARRKAKRI